MKEFDLDELWIVFKEDRAYLADNVILRFEQLELPSFAKSFYSTAYWKMKVISYNTESKRLFGTISSYHIGEIDIPSEQLELAPELAEIQSIKFRSIDTGGLMRTLHGNKPITHISTSVTHHHLHEDTDLLLSTTDTHTHLEPTAEQSHEFIASKKIYEERFSIPFSDVRFVFGGIEFEKKIPLYPHPISIRIYNEHIRLEFDAIKNYFSKYLKTKKINVYIKIEINGTDVTVLQAVSKEISKINPGAIDSIKFEFVQSGWKKKIPTAVDKSLFTLDEYFSHIADQPFTSNTFYKNENHFLDELVEITQTKHYKHLRYLSSIHAHDIMKLRFVLKPFSFIFLVQAEKQYHIIWETLDTEEATYLWHVEKNITAIKQALAQVEHTIHTIQLQGKKVYISTAEEPFRRVFHDYSAVADGFVKWKSELDHYLY